MKRLYLILLLLYPASLFAQDSDYRPFVEEGKVWVSGCYGEIYPSETPHNYIVYDYFDGDTVVNGVGCKRWIERFVPRDAPGAPILTYTMSAYEENGKVWLFHEGETTPRLIYDFLAEPGDTVVIYSAFPYKFLWAKDYYGTTDKFFETKDILTIQSKNVEDVYGHSQRVTFYKSFVDWFPIFAWYLNSYIEGIGSFRGPSDCLSYNNGTDRCHLAYCLAGDEIIFYNEAVVNSWNMPLPTSVAVPHAVSGSKMPWTDLSGRHFSTPPAKKGIYIRGGRKVMVK